MSQAQQVAPAAHDPFPERGAIPVPRAKGLISGLIDSTFRANLRTATFTMRSITGTRSRSFDKLDLPKASHGPLAGLHAAVDELIMVYFEAGRNEVAELDFERIEVELEDLIVHHNHLGVSDDPFSHHDDPPAPLEVWIEERHFGGVQGEWMTFVSEWEPHPAAPGRERWLSNDNNATVHVGLLRHDDGPRPWLLLVHGAEMGRPKLDARLLRAERLHRELGVNVAMPVLPMHGPRAEKGGAIRGTFPSMEMADNVHGLSQGIWDIRRTLSWIRQQEATAIGVYGFSLGGYVASLLAGLEADLDALVVGCPVIDIVDLFTQNTPPLRSGSERLATLYERARLAHQPITPLHFDRVLPTDRIALFGATADRLTDPVDQLWRIWEHWDRPELQWVDGGHVTYFMKNEPVDQLVSALKARGVYRSPLNYDNP